MCAERKKRRGPSAIPCRPAWTQTMYTPLATKAIRPANPITRWITRRRISGPPFAHGADLDVDKPQRQRDFPHRVLGDVGFDLRRLLRPRDPNEAGRFEA